MPGLREYHSFINDLEAELVRIESLLAGAGLPCATCRAGCSECCVSLTVLPLEAYAIMSECEQEGLGVRSGGNGGEGCAFLQSDRSCAIYRARPYLCRTRGFPILHLNGDGEWERDSCVKRSFPPLSAGAPGLKLEIWNARLFHLNETFCAERGIAPRRVALADLRMDHIPSFSPAC